jgi:predicted metal-dependent peptidase
MQAEEKLRRAFDNIYDQHPFLAAIVASWKVHESQRIKTAATNGPQMFWNRKFIDTCSIGETTALVYHEAFHIFLLHHLRFAGIDATEWNIAADLAGNYHCREYIPRRIGNVDLCFPGQGSYSHLEVGKDAEWYYKKLKDEQKKQPKPQPGQGKPEKGEGEGSGGSQDKSDESQDEKDESEGSGEAGDQEQENSEGNSSGDEKSEDESEPEEGEGAGGGSGELPSEPNLPEGFESSDMPGEILPYPGEITEEVVREWEQRTAEAINIAKSHGNAPGFIKQLAEELLGGKSRVNWKAELRRFLTKYAPTRYSYAKPNRRFSWRKDVIMPARKSRTAAPGVVYLDTSGSMDEAQFNRGLLELRGILEAYEYCEVTLVQGDTEIYWDAVKVYDRWSLGNNFKVPSEWVGRGGTELGPGLQELAKSGKYSWIVVVSDMYWSVNRVEDVGVPTFWLMTAGKPVADYMIPKFGVAIELPQEEA